LGANKLMHTIIAQHCTGCELCIPVCPVDCIALVNASGAATGWSAWSPAQAQHARQRYVQHQQRLLNSEEIKSLSDAAPAPDNKKAAIAAALARARAQRQL
jgi:electron transport complex protein RnfB